MKIDVLIHCHWLKSNWPIKYIELISAVTKLLNKFREMGERLVTTNEDVQRSLTQSNTMTERAYADISRSYDTLRTEVKHSANKYLYLASQVHSDF